MGLSALQDLSIVIIIYFLPASFITTWLCYTRGIGIQWGWLYLAILSVFRVVGAILQIIAEQNGNKGIRIAAEMLASVGITTLILAMLEMIERIKMSMRPDEPIHPRIWTFLHLAQYAVFILYIVGMSMSRDDINKAAVVLLTVVFALQSTICIYFYFHRAARKCDQRLVLVAVMSIPFLAVRVGYGVSRMFVDEDAPYRSNVAIAALLQYLMEFVVVGLFVYAGVRLVPRKAKKGDGESQFKLLNPEGGQRDSRSEP